MASGRVIFPQAAQDCDYWRSHQLNVTQEVLRGLLQADERSCLCSISRQQRETWLLNYRLGLSNKRCPAVLGKRRGWVNVKVTVM